MANSFFLRNIKVTKKFNIEKSTFESKSIQTKKRLIRIVQNKTSYFPNNETNI